MFYTIVKAHNADTQRDRTSPKLPNHALFGYGTLDVEETLVADYRAAGIRCSVLQKRVHSYGQATGKTFTTWKTTDGAQLYIKRVA